MLRHSSLGALLAELGRYLIKSRGFPSGGVPAGRLKVRERRQVLDLDVHGFLLQMLS